MYYKNPIMKVSELMEYGFSKELLMNYCRCKASTAFQSSPAKNAPYFIITEDFEKYRLEMLTKKRSYATSLSNARSRLNR